MIYLGELHSPFLMEIKVYTTPGCYYCEQLKELFSRAEVEYDAVQVLPEDHQKFKEEHTTAVGFPHVIIDGEHIGGLVETAKLFLQKGLVSSKKK